MGEEKSGSFKGVKTLLIMLYMCALIYAIIFIGQSIYDLVRIGSNDGSNDDSNGQKLTPEEIENKSRISMII